MSKLEFYIDKNNEGCRLIDGERKEKLSYDLDKLFDFAISFSIDKDIPYKRVKYYNGSNSNIRITFDEGKYILSSYNKKINKKNFTYKLKRKAIIGTIIAMTGIIGTSVVTGNNNKNNYYHRDTGNIRNLKVSGNFYNNSKKNNNELRIIDFSYEDRSNSSVVSKAKNYDEYFKKYGNMYGIDYRLLRAIMCQESGGEHKSYSVNGSAIGGMQIEDVNFGSTIYAYNHDSNSMESFKVDEDKVRDASYNIKVGAMILENLLNTYNYDVAKAVQAYNFGMGNMNHLGDDWKSKRSSLGIGDDKYLEHVFSYIPNGEVLEFKKRDNSDCRLMVNNKEKINDTNKVL